MTTPDQRERHRHAALKWKRKQREAQQYAPLPDERPVTDFTPRCPECGERIGVTQDCKCP